MSTGLSTPALDEFARSFQQPRARFVAKRIGFRADFLGHVGAFGRGFVFLAH
jgi:hypothetical protein